MPSVKNQHELPINNKLVALSDPKWGNEWKLLVTIETKWEVEQNNFKRIYFYSSNNLMTTRWWQDLLSFTNLLRRVFLLHADANFTTVIKILVFFYKTCYTKTCYTKTSFQIFRKKEVFFIFLNVSCARMEVVAPKTNSCALFFAECLCVSTPTFFLV